MEPAPYHVELLADHDRSQFRSGSRALDQYFKTRVTQDVRRRVTNCFVATTREKQEVAGFCTIAAASIPTFDLPDAITKKLPRYHSIPAVRVGRLAVDLRHQGRGLGGALLADAAIRGERAEAAAFAVIVDAKDEAAVAFYEHHGFQRLASRPQSLFLVLGAKSHGKPNPR